MSGLVAQRINLPAGGGPYALPRLTIGVFLTDQPSHRLTLGSDRRRHLPLKRQEGWILPAGAEGLCEFDAALDFATVSLPPEMLAAAGLDADPASVAPVIGALDPLLVQMVLQAEQFAAGGALYAQTMGQALALHMTRSLLPAEPSVAAIDDARLRRAVEHIRAHLADDLSLDTMAGIAAMSPSHFARAFKQATGASPLQFVIAERLEAALALLRTTRLSVAEVAFRVGYNDVPRFGQHFKRRFGRTPAAARGSAG
ncbi:MAG: AraC family transcriptional regulator [Pseudomonadota bacterium]